MRRFVVVAIAVVLSGSYGDMPTNCRLPIFVGQARVPEPAASVMVKHLRHIIDNGWGQLRFDDLYHGHILMKPGAACRKNFGSFDELIACSSLMLYHSDEKEYRWQGTQKGIPITDRTPRSIVGYWEDGEVAPAARLVSDPEHTAQDYPIFGTIHDRDLMAAMPTMVAERRVWTFDVPEGTCSTILQVEFEPDVFSTHAIMVDCADVH